MITYRFYKFFLKPVSQKNIHEQWIQASSGMTNYREQQDRLKHIAGSLNEIGPFALKTEQFRFMNGIALGKIDTEFPQLFQCLRTLHKLGNSF